MARRNEPMHKVDYWPIRTATWENSDSGKIGHRIVVSRSTKVEDDTYKEEKITCSRLAELILLIEAASETRDRILRRREQLFDARMNRSLDASKKQRSADLSSVPDDEPDLQEVDLN
jgi:hypothetical protein